MLCISNVLEALLGNNKGLATSLAALQGTDTS
jgi:hypothetical protein